MGPAAQRWRELLTTRAIPPDTPSRRVALDLLGAGGGTVLDVGCGGGAAALALVPPAQHVTGTDSAADMLDAFTHACRERGVAHRTVLGSWPDTAAEAGTADVVVCHHVGYNTADLGPFVSAIDAAVVRVSCSNCTPSTRRGGWTRCGSGSTGCAAPPRPPRTTCPRR